MKSKAAYHYRAANTRTKVRIFSKSLVGTPYGCINMLLLYVVWPAMLRVGLALFWYGYGTNSRFSSYFYGPFCWPYILDQIWLNPQIFSRIGHWGGQRIWHVSLAMDDHQPRPLQLQGELLSNNFNFVRKRCATDPTHEMMGLFGSRIIAHRLQLKLTMYRSDFS